MSLLFDNLLGIKPKGFGIEIEDDSIKAFQLGKAEKTFSFYSCGVRNLRKGIVQNGQIVEAKALADEIRELMKSCRPKSIKTKFVVFSIPETKAFIRTIQVPRMSREEAEEAVKWETEANIPVSVDKVYLDWQVIGEKDKNDEVLVAAVSKEIIDSYCQAFNLAGLSVLAIEVDIIATTRSLILENDQQPLLIVDIGAEKTSLAICKNQVPYFTSSLPICGKTFTDALQKGLGVSYKKAEELKTKYGLGKMKKDDMLYNIYNPVIENIAAEIEKSINFYTESINSQEKVERVILSGGGALLREMSDYLSVRIQKPVVAGNPLINIRGGQNLSPEKAREFSPFATSIGLAMRANNYED